LCDGDGWGDLDQELVGGGDKRHTIMSALYPGFDLSMRRSGSFVQNEGNEFPIPSLLLLLQKVIG
jgi:hypothetical protein